MVEAVHRMRSEGVRPFDFSAVFNTIRRMVVFDSGGAMQRPHRQKEIPVMPVGIRASLTLILALSLIAAGLESIEAQAAQRTTPPEMSSDSTAWQRVLVYVVGSLGTQIVQAAADTAPQPWRLRLPSDEPQRRLLEMQLTTILRARPVTDSDAVIYTLDIGPISIRNDTARVRVSVDVTRRCPGSTRTTGSGNFDDVFVPRAPQGFWGAARSSRTLHGDRVGCMRNGP